MSGFITFVCGDGNLTVQKANIVAKLSLFQNNPDLATARTYELRCNPQVATLTLLLPRILDSSEEVIITDDNFTELQNLVRELGFSGLDADLKAFSASQAGSTVKQRIGELEERVDDHDVQIYGVDTRCLTKMLREEGSMKGKILIDGMPDVEFVDPNLENQVAKVSCKEVITYGNGSKKVVLVDCGVKHNILRCFLKRDVTLYRVPWDYDFNGMEMDGLFISNGPGDPAMCKETIEHIRTYMQTGKPIWGICMGNQLLSLASGAKTYKLRYGHRSHNQPVRKVGTNQCFITSQNHGFAVDNDTLGSDWEPLFLNMNDNTNEGIRHKTMPWFSCQFHPEAASGPVDTEFMFDDFVSLL